MDEINLHFKKVKTWKDNSLKLLIAIIWIAMILFGPYSSLNDIYSNYVLGFWVLVSVFYLVMIFVKNKRTKTLTINSYGIKSEFFKQNILWNDISNIELKYTTFGDSKVILQHKNEIPWYKCLLIHNNRIISIVSKRSKINLDFWECKPETVFQQMKEYFERYNAK